MLAPESAERLRSSFGDRLLPIGDADAAIYAANSFAFLRDGIPHMVMPRGISSALEDRIRALGVALETVDVSEFYKKGGGSLKCMVGDLGELP